MTKLFFKRKREKFGICPKFVIPPPQICLCSKRKGERVKFVAAPKEMLLLFSILWFLSNYDIINRKHSIELVYSIVRKGHKGPAN